MGSTRKSEEQLTQEIMKLVNQLYGTMKGDPEAIQQKVASILADSAEQAAEQENESDRINRRRAIEMAKNGEKTKSIMEETGLTEMAVKWMRKTEGIMSRDQVRELIMAQKSNEEIQEQSKWTIDAIERMRKEIEERIQRRKADRKERSDRRNAMLKEERRGRVEAKKEERDAKDQMLRVLLAQGLSMEKIATSLGYQYPHTVSVKKSKGKLLGRKEIVALLPEKSDEELLAITGINDISVIEQIRQQEMPKLEQAKKEQEERERQKEEARKSEDARNQTFRIALAQGKSGAEIATLVGLKNAGSVKQKKHDMRALSRQQIIKLLPEKSNEELVTITGINDISVIEQIRQEEMPETSKESKNAVVEDGAIQNAGPILQEQERVAIPIIKRKDEKQFLKLAGTLTSVEEIAQKLGLSEDIVRVALIDYNIFSREEVIEWLDYRTDMQIAIMGNLEDYTIVARVRKAEKEKQLCMDIDEGELNVEQIEIEHKQREEQVFLKMARNFEGLDKLKCISGLTEYAVILKLRKLQLCSRPEVERLIEEGKASNAQIAGQTGNINAVERIRNRVYQRERLIRSIPEEKQRQIRSGLLAGRAIDNIAFETKTTHTVVKAIQEKWLRDKEIQVTEERKKVNFRIEWITFDAKVKNITESSSRVQKDVLINIINKMLVVYEKLLTQRHYAYMAYTYMKMGEYIKGIEFSKDYLNLQHSSISGVKNRIDEILEQEREAGKLGESSSLNIKRIKWEDFTCIGG
ncbi:MAG: hypothetical protein HFJ29_00270 [Clostridia bacterium]|nr:hypothetical protein [Clostridia bacterium]